MGITLNPYLNFRGNAREAMEFYEGVFGGKLNVSTFADYHAASDPSENDLVMHADLEGPEGIRFMAADTPIKMEYRPGTNFSMSLSGDDEAELRGYSEKLAERGSVTMPLEKAPWGDIFGMYTDRFGISWLVNDAATAN
ncbi:MAG TPA: VOC family protein [Actinomycetota bacterium]